MEKVRTYHVVEADSVEELQKEVMLTIKNGYIPIGGVSVIKLLDHYKFFQAIALYED